MLLSTAISKIILGMSLAAPFGPLSAEGLNRGLHGGFSAAFAVRFGGVIGNFACLVVSYLFLSALMQLDIVSLYAGACGSIALLILSYKQLKQEITFEEKDIPTDNKNNMVIGFILAIANPFGIIWWLSVYAATQVKSIQQSAGFAPNMFIIVGTLTWAFIFSGLVHMLKQNLPIKVISLISKVSSLIIMGYGIYYGYVSLAQMI